MMVDQSRRKNVIVREIWCHRFIVIIIEFLTSRQKKKNPLCILQQLLSFSLSVENLWKKNLMKKVKDLNLYTRAKWICQIKYMVEGIIDGV